MPLGIVLGYALTGIIVSYTTWKVAFWAQSVLLIFLFLAYLFYPSKYYMERAKREEINAKRSLINTMREKELINKSDKEDSEVPSPGGSQV